VKSSPPTKQHPTFYMPDAICPINSVRALKGKALSSWHTQHLIIAVSPTVHQDFWLVAFLQAEAKPKFNGFWSYSTALKPRTAWFS